MADFERLTSLGAAFERIRILKGHLMMDGERPPGCTPFVHLHHLQPA